MRKCGFMKRIRFTTGLLVVLFCLLPIMMLLMIHHLTLSDTLAKMGTGSFGNSYSCISLEEGNDPVQQLISSMDMTNSKYAICLDETLTSGTTIRYIFFNRQYANLPMEQGRFFNRSDFEPDKNAAVVGKNKKGEIYERNGQKYIMVQGIECDVLGVIGYENQTLLDDYIFVNLLAGIEKNTHMYLIDLFSNENADLLIKSCLDNMQLQGFSGEVLTVGENYSDSIMPQIYSVRWLIILVVCCFLCLILISGQWIYQQKREICIKRLNGASLQNVIGIIVGRYCLIILVTSLIGILYCNYLYSTYSWLLIQGYIMFLPFIVFFASWTVCTVIKTPIGETIK